MTSFSDPNLFPFGLFFKLNQQLEDFGITKFVEQKKHSASETSQLFAPGVTCGSTSFWLLTWATLPWVLGFGLGAPEVEVSSCVTVDILDTFFLKNPSWRMLDVFFFFVLNKDKLI